MNDWTAGRRAERRVLVLAYYFPPMGLSGVQRTAKFVKYLPRFGWQPTVVTCHPRGYFAYDVPLLEEIEAAGIEIHRTASWDPTRLFGRREVVDLPPESARRAFSRMSQAIFVPDNKIGWWIPARRKARAVLRETPFDLIFASAPPYTAHLVGGGLARSSGLPLVLDFRDDWVGNPRHAYPTRLHRALSSFLERRALQSADRIIVINEIIRRNLAARNPDAAASHEAVVIPQGFDPDDLRVAPSIPGLPAHADTFTLVYCGVFYDAQSPEPFLRALADVVTRRAGLKSRIKAVFVGLLPESAKKLAEALGLAEAVHHTGYLPHHEAVACLRAADVLWMTVGRSEGAESISTSKLYEYFGTEKPILGLVPPGAARDALSRYGASEVVDPDAISEISAGIERLFQLWTADRLPRPARDFVDAFNRERLTERLAHQFDRAIRNRDAPALHTGGTRA